MRRTPALSATAPRPLPWPFVLPLVIVALLPVAAFAHDGAHGGDTFATGFGHPLGGADHVLAMLAVGLWAAMTGGRAIWALPLAFVTAMLAGGALGASGAALPGVEPMILASIMVLGALAGLALRLPLPGAVALVAVFGVAHGFAHGVEWPSADLAAYAAGFAIATALLHGIGLAAGLLLVRLPLAARGLGAATALGGLALAVQP
jgi:urease accessory protein